MHLTHAEENKNRAISLLISLGILGLLLLFLFLFIIPIPNPLFPETTAGGGGGTEINFGTYNEGTGNVEGNGIGNATSVVENTESTPPPTPNVNSENIVTSETGEDVNITKTNPKVENNTTVITPTKVEVKPKTAAELLKEKFLKNQGKNGGGDGNSGHAGNDGSPDGNPNTHGTGGTGGGTGGGDGGGDGPDKGPGSGHGPGGVGFSLAGRSMVKPPSLPKNITEEGKVVVEIVVDKNGNVIKAEANGRGTNTNSSNLKTIARQAAFATKFNVSGAEGEQKGTLTMVFSF
jgi:outer membrane biosynthesis protein TonB